MENETPATVKKIYVDNSRMIQYYDTFPPVSPCKRYRIDIHVNNHLSSVLYAIHSVHKEKWCILGNGFFFFGKCTVPWQEEWARVYP